MRVALATALVESAGLVAPPEELFRQLAEYDPNYIDLIVDTAYWDRIGDPGKTDTTQERQTMIKASCRAWRSSPLDQWVKWTWTAEGLGQGVSLVTEDAAAQAQWDEFWKADRNAALLSDARLHNLSFDLLNYGNLFLAFYASPVDGEATVRDIDPDEIADIIRSPSDKRQAWFYKREYLEAGSVAGSRTLYYPDWSIFFDGDELERAWMVALDRNLVPQNAERADLVQQDADLGDAATTRVCVLHIAHNCKVRGDPWGWPLSTVSMPYQRGHKQFIQATLSKVLAVSQFVRRSRVQGGSRAVNSVLDTVRSTLTSSNRLETNPAPVPGASWHVENQSVQTEELPLSTAAGDTDRDNKTLAWAALLGGGLFPATAGLDVARYATALTMDRVQAFIFSWYQRFWSSQFRTMFKIVLGYAGMSTDIETTVSIDSYGLPDFPEMVGPTTALMQSITQSVGASVIGAADAREMFSALLRPVMQAIGASDISDLLDFEEPPAPPTPTPEPDTEEPEEEPDQDTVEEGGKGSGWFGPDKGGTHGKGSQGKKESQAGKVLARLMPASNIKDLDLPPGGELYQAKEKGRNRRAFRFAYNPRTNTLVAGTGESHAGIIQRYAPRQAYDDFVKMGTDYAWTPSEKTKLRVYSGRHRARDAAEDWDLAFRAAATMRSVGFPDDTIVQIIKADRPPYTELARMDLGEV